MTEIEAEVRRWGNSMGIIIPKDAVAKESLKPGDKVWVTVRKIRYPLPGSFGAGRHWKVDAQQLKDEIRAEERDAEERTWRKRGD